MRTLAAGVAAAFGLLSCGPTVVVQNNVPIGAPTPSNTAPPPPDGSHDAKGGHGKDPEHGGHGHGSHGAAGNCVPSHGTHWSYDGASDGPSAWGSLSTEFKVCSTGKKQSPIDIVTKKVVRDSTLRPPSLRLQNAKVTGFINNGHTLELHFQEGSGITVEGKDFALKNVHFHVPAEHTIDGKLYDMEMHIVHLDKLSGPTAARVLGVFMDRGDDNPLLSTILSKFPGPKSHAVCTNKPESDFVLDLGTALPKRSDAFFTYEGGLTTPGCGEFVQFFLAQTPMTVSASQLEAYVRTVGHAKTNRPVQPLNGRTVRANR